MPQPRTPVVALVAGAPDQERQPKGDPKGGQFAPAGGEGRDDAAKSAQQDKGAQGNYGKLDGLSGDAAKAFLKGLSEKDLTALTAISYSAKTSDPKVVANRNKVAAEMGRRGLDITKHGAKGGGPAKPKPGPKKTVKASAGPIVRIVTAADADVQAVVAAVAGAIPTSPPSAWFDRATVPEDGGPLTITSDGRVYGLAAPEIDHIGMPGQHQRPPKSKTGYRWFHTGAVRCDDGTMVATGRITMGGGHAPLNADASAASSHYDDVGYAIADVIAWDTPAGTMCAGAARPGLTAEQIRTAMASPPSGDWRPVGGPDIDMVGVHLVNTPGFPISRVGFAASGEPCALIAAGSPAIRITTTQEAPVPAPDPTPAFTADQPVLVDPAGLPQAALIASIDGDRALVTVDVPLSALTDAGQEGRALLASGQRDRVRDAQLDQLTEQVRGLTASIEQEREDRADQAALDAIPTATG